MAPGIHHGLQFTAGHADPKSGTAGNEHSLHGDGSGALSATNPHPYGRLPCIGEASRQASRSRHSNVSSTVAAAAVGLQNCRSPLRPSSSLRGHTPQAALANARRHSCGGCHRSCICCDATPAGRSARVGPSFMNTITSSTSHFFDLNCLCYHVLRACAYVPHGSEVKVSSLSRAQCGKFFFFGPRTPASL